MSFQPNYAVHAREIVMIFRTSYPVGNDIQCHETREIQTLERKKEIISKWSRSPAEKRLLGFLWGIQLI